MLAGEGSGGRLRPRRWGHGGGSPVDSQVSLSTQMSSHGPSRAEGLTEGERWVRASCRWGPSGPADTGGGHLLGRGGGLRLTLPHPPGSSYGQGRSPVPGEAGACGLTQGKFASYLVKVQSRTSAPRSPWGSQAPPLSWLRPPPTQTGLGAVGGSGRGGL